MSLSVINNVSALIAETNINSTSNSISGSLERLSTGLKINSGADGPAALVIGNEQQAQITGLQSAIQNSNEAVSLVQTGDGALNEISSLLNQVRGLAVSSANTGVNDSTALAANQTQIQNALATINQIAGDTQFGNTKLFTGTAGYNGTATNVKVSVLKVTGAATVGLNAVSVSTAATKANLTAGAAITAGGLAQAETLTINGTAINLASGASEATVINQINNYTTQTGVTAQDNGSGDIQLYGANYGSANTFTVQSSVATGAGGTGFGTGTQTATGTDIVGTINGNAAIGTGNVLSGGGIAVSIGAAAGATANYTTTTGALGSVNVVNDSLTFQIGANAGQTAQVAFNNVTTSSLGIGANGSSTANLASIDVRSASGAQDAIRVVDQAINDISNLQGTLGAFQANTLTANTANLQTALQNTTAAESTVMDTNYAQEIATFTQNQVQLQAGASALNDANQIPQIIVKLLQG